MTHVDAIELVRHQLKNLDECWDKMWRMDSNKKKKLPTVDHGVDRTGRESQEVEMWQKSREIRPKILKKV